MIAKSKCIGHVLMAAAYAAGETIGKQYKAPEGSIRLVYRQNVEPLSTPDTIDWLFKEMARGTKVKNYAISTFFSVPKEVSENWSDADWHRITSEYLSEYQGLSGVDSRGVDLGKAFDLSDCAIVGYLHEDAGVPHVHLLISRVDGNRRVIPNKWMQKRAAAAAANLAKKHGWKLAEDVRKDNASKLNDEIRGVLRNMKEFDWAVFFGILNRRGYEIIHRCGNNGKIVSWGLKTKAGSYFKASTISRAITASRIEDTWRSLHIDARQFAGERKGPDNAATGKPAVDGSGAIKGRAAVWNRFTAVIGDNEYFYEMSNGQQERLEGMIRNMIESDPAMPYGLSVEDVDFAVLQAGAALVFGMIGGAIVTPTAQSVGGGVGSNDLPRKKNEDEDDVKKAAAFGFRALKSWTNRSGRGRSR